MNDAADKKKYAADKRELIMRAHSVKGTGQVRLIVSMFPRILLFVMFSSGCGSRLLATAKFGYLCGLTIGVKDDNSFCVAELEMESSERKRHQSTPLVFEEYRATKGKGEARGLLVGSL